MSGDGFLAYHEFIFHFPIRAKPVAPVVAFDQQLRAELLKVC